MSEVQKLGLTEILLRTPVGQSFFTETKDTVVGSYAYRIGVKVQTERMLAIRTSKKELIDITRVTVLSIPQKSLPRKSKEIASTGDLRHAGRRRRQPVVEVNDET